jgi:hypothetical protein
LQKSPAFFQLLNTLLNNLKMIQLLPRSIRVR